MLDKIEEFKTPGLGSMSDMRISTVDARE